MALTPAQLWTKMSDNRVRCGLCSHFCVIEPGERGHCHVRENKDGTLLTYAYDRVAAVGVDPVEKKPLYHFMPGTRTFSFATMGCNLDCSFCQNWTLSQSPKHGQPFRGDRTSPDDLVATALAQEAGSISYTYSEPTIFFELMQDTARLAHDHGLKNIMVSNGFMSRECLERLEPLIDAANIDLKSFSEEFYAETCGARLAPVLNNLRAIHEMGWWLEVTTLLIPGQNDSPEELDQIATFIAEELGEDTPWHLSRYHPDYKMNVGPTAVSSLETARNIGRSKGLNYVYIGNAAGKDFARTVCPGCGETLVERLGFEVLVNNLKGNTCARCGAHIAGVFNGNGDA